MSFNELVFFFCKLTASVSVLIFNATATCVGDAQLFAVTRGVAGIDVGVSAPALIGAVTMAVVVVTFAEARPQLPLLL